MISTTRINKCYAPLPLCADDELDLQIGAEIVRHVVGSTIPKIEPLRRSLRLAGKFLGRIHIRDNPTMSPHAFVLRHFGTVVADGEFPSDGDILQALTLAARSV
jgi:hypothetical protein